LQRTYSCEAMLAFDGFAFAWSGLVLVKAVV
jgi:hypothetical protein